MTGLFILKVYQGFFFRSFKICYTVLDFFRKRRFLRMANKAKQSVQELLSHRFVKEILGIYLFLIFVVYPLYYEDAYYNMGDAKWNFFRTVTYYIDGPMVKIPTFLVLLLIFFIWYQIDLIRSKSLVDFWKKNVTLTDKFVLFYLVACLISTVLSPDKDTVIWGYNGWYMGMIAQFAFCALYFFVSRFWRWDDIMIAFYLLASTIVNLLGVLNRFHIDPLNMYEGLDEYYLTLFLSTLGQSTWYSSYVMIFFPIGLFMYWFAEKKWVRKLTFVYMVIGFMTALVQDSDSALFALYASLLTLFSFSFRENKYMKRFIEIILTMLLSWRVIGFFRMAFPERAVPLGGIMTYAAQGPALWLHIILIAVIYVILTKKDKEGKADVTGFSFLRTAAYVLTVLGILLAVIYIYLNTKKLLPPSLSSDSWYLVFDEFWGNNRGSSWMVTLDSIRQTVFLEPVRFVFGAGPDCFYDTVYNYHAEELIAKWGENTVLTCAHNEWMSQIVNTGIIGGIAYLGIFVSAFVTFVKKSDKIPELIAPAMCVAAYFWHNFFCYQQIICTPIIFIIMGAGISIVRTGGLRAIYEAD